jgi:hypothetical protein
MPVDPSDPDTFDDENATGFSDEAPEADAQEQHADVAPHRDDPLSGTDLDTANEADRAEQSRIVELNEDEYR